MKTFRYLLIAFALAAAPAPLPEALAQERDVPLSQLPEKVKAAAEKAVPGIVLTEAEARKIKDGWLFEIEGRVGTKEYELLIKSDGEVLRVQREDGGVPVPLDKIPKKVLAAAQKAVKGFVPAKAQARKTKGGWVYEIEGKVGSKEYELLIKSTGHVLRVRLEDNDDEEHEDDDGDKRRK